MSDDIPKDAEKVDTSVSREGLLRLFRDHANRGIDPDDDVKRKHALENIRDVCEAVLEDE